MLRETQLLCGPWLSSFLLFLNRLFRFDLVDEVGNAGVGEQLAKRLDSVDQVVKSVVEV